LGSRRNDTSRERSASATVVVTWWNLKKGEHKVTSLKKENPRKRKREKGREGGEEGCRRLPGAAFLLKSFRKVGGGRERSGGFTSVKGREKQQQNGEKEKEIANNLKGPGKKSAPTGRKTKKSARTEETYLQKKDTTSHKRELSQRRESWLAP